MAAVTLPTHYRNVFAEQGYAQAEIDARIENNLHRIEFESRLRRMPIMGVPSTIWNTGTMSFIWFPFWMKAGI